MEFTIRPTRQSDAAALAALRRMPGVLENTLGTPSVRDDSQEKYLGAIGDNTHSFVAVTTLENGAELVIGNAGLEVYSRPRIRHCGGFGIMVHTDYQGKGVGKALLEAILDMADNWLKLVRVELTVFTDNERAIHLYKKYGFEEEGIRRMAAIRNGVYDDELAMARLRP